MFEVGYAVGQLAIECAAPFDLLSWWPQNQKRARIRVNRLPQPLGRIQAPQDEE